MKSYRINVAISKFLLFPSMSRELINMLYPGMQLLSSLSLASLASLGRDEAGSGPKEPRGLFVGAGVRSTLRLCAVIRMETTESACFVRLSASKEGTI